MNDLYKPYDGTPDMLRASSKQPQCPCGSGLMPYVFTDRDRVAHYSCDTCEQERHERFLAATQPSNPLIGERSMTDADIKGPWIALAWILGFIILGCFANGSSEPPWTHLP